MPGGRCLSEILTVLGVDPGRVAIELNRSIVSRSAWNDVIVDANATLEIVQFVGGG